MARRILMKSLFMLALSFAFLFIAGCRDKGVVNIKDRNQVNIIFLHHSTGLCIWDGQLSELGRFSKLAKTFGFKSDVPKWFNHFNVQNGTNYKITETSFPKKSPYGWNNYPYDYYNIWVMHSGDQPYKEEPTLEMLTKKYDVIIFKHCYPVSQIQADNINPDINSDEKTLTNYKMQYEALKKKMNEFPDTKFVIWTPTALVEKSTNKEAAQRADEFSEWVKTVWDTPGDNIFLWDFRSLQVDNGLYFKNSYATSETNSHPNSEFAHSVAPYFCKRIVDVIQGSGDTSSLTGK